MKVWLDDDRDPTDEFIQREFGAAADMLWVKTAAEAVDVLRAGGVTAISLDHDLGATAEEIGTGYDVAKWIEKAAFDGELPRLSWRLHTASPVGRKSMMAALRNADAFWTAAEERVQ
jgi:hypothetical protein